MGAGHDHSNGTRSSKSVARLKIALALTFVYMIAEAVGGWLANSLALVADAGHMLTDVAAMLLTLFAFWFAARPATSKKTYGYYRIEILAAFVNGVVLVALSFWVIVEAVKRWQDPPDVKGVQLLVIATGGLAVNIASAWLLHSGDKHDLNMRGAFLHVMGDLLGSIAAIVAGLLVLWFGWMWADPIGSILISAVIVIGAWRLILDSVNVLLEGTPSHISVPSVETTIMEMKGVTGIHDLHIWTISSGIDALSVHISHNDSVLHSELLGAVRDRLHDVFGIDHLTIQMEATSREGHAVYTCETGSNCFEPTTRSKFANG